MELKNEENVNNEYVSQESVKPKKSLKKWGIVGATIIVAGIAAVGSIAVIKNQNESAGELSGAVVIPAHNLNFSQYTGINRSSSDLKALLANVKKHNDNNEAVLEYGAINIVYGNNFSTNGGITEEPNYTVTDNAQAVFKGDKVSLIEKSKIRDSKYYTIAITEYSNLGSVSQFTVWQQANYISN